MIDYNDESDDDASAPRGEHEIDNGKHEVRAGEAKNHYPSFPSPGKSRC